ncbi:MAG: efflux RND transporter permease subunit, partial [Flavobacteriia bacterium]|nr:efflux RND transporter permease subunit [Flavobacteriia bacterium]
MLHKKSVILTVRLFVFFIGLSFVHLRAQSYTMDTTVESKVLASAHYATGWTGGDLVNRYGFMNLVGFSAGYKLKNNWFFQTDASFLFGSQIKIPGLLNGITDSYGNITDVNGDPAAVNIVCRGVTANVVAGKIIPLSKFHRNSGIMVHAGAGYLNHRIKIETQTQVEFTKDTYHAALWSFIEGALLAAAVVFVFFRNWRATWITALGIPLSVIPTFLIMQWLGFS